MREDRKVPPNNAEYILVNLWKAAISGDADCVDAMCTIVYRIPSRGLFFLVENDDDN